MPKPSSVIRNAAPLRKLERKVGEVLTSDFGTEEPVPLVPKVPPVQVNPPTAPSAPATSDRAKVDALVRSAQRADPSLSLKPHVGPQAMDRSSILFDPATHRRIMDLCLAKEMSPSAMLQEALPWAKANASVPSLIWAQKQVTARRKVLFKKKKAALKGGEEEELPAGGIAFTVFIPLSAFSHVKTLWNASGLKKKGFFEACLYLFLEIHAPQK